MGDLYTDTRVRVHGGGQLPGQARLPELDELEPRHDGLLGTIGRVAGEHPWLLLGAPIVAGAGAALAGNGGLLARSLRGAGGAIAGFAGAVALCSLAERVAGFGSSDTRAYEVASPRPLEVDPNAAPEQLRVMSWNLHALMGPGEGERQDPAAIANVKAVVEREHPDVLVLQEVQRDDGFGAPVDDLAVLADALGATDAVLVPNGTRPNGTQKGQAILTFGGVRIQDARGLAHADPNGSGPVRELVGALGWAKNVLGTKLIPTLGPAFHPRTTTDVMLTTPAGRAVRVLDVHLSGTGGTATGGSPDSTERMQQQLVPVAETIDAWQGPTLLAGDFNVRGGTEFEDFEAGVLGAHGMRDAFTDAGIDTGSEQAQTFSAGNPRANLDRVYASDDFSVRRVHVASGEHARGGSDHLPVIADLELR
jgi:endonuclease/exonuclease/phosphatase family metal-dependent hydrolase